MNAKPLAITFASPAHGAEVLAKVLHVDWRAEWPLVQRVDDGPNVTLHRLRSRVVADMLNALRGAAIACEIAVRGETLQRWVGRPVPTGMFAEALAPLDAAFSGTEAPPGGAVGGSR
jgi:hypothetical protein